jgi:hypothetical protein
MGYGKYHMEVLYVQGIFHPVFDPKRLLCRLTFRAMPVSATVITYPLMIAVVALFQVPTQS